MPVTEPGLALAAVASVGGALNTVTFAVPRIEPLVAVIVTLPGVLEGVKRPPAVIVPELAVHAKTGCTAKGLPNWSRATAVNVWVEKRSMFPVAGLTTMLVNVELTVTVTLLATDSPPASVIVAVRS